MQFIGEIYILDHYHCFHPSEPGEMRRINFWHPFLSCLVFHIPYKRTKSSRNEWMKNIAKKLEHSQDYFIDLKSIPYYINIISTLWSGPPSRWYVWEKVSFLYYFLDIWEKRDIFRKRCIGNKQKSDEK